jgi:chromosome segregation ATPase
VALSEKSRSAIFQSLAPIAGEEAIAEMLSFFPSREADTPATRADLELTRAELRREMAELRTEMAELRTDLRTEMAELRTDLRTEMADLRTELQRSLNRLLIWLVATIIATAGVAVGAAAQLSG